MLASYLKSTSHRAGRAFPPLKREVVGAVRRMLTPRGAWSWQRFHREVRAAARPLLRELPAFRNAILVSGCQRSGTTLVSRMITSSAEMADYRTRDDDELDAALILCGLQKPPRAGRYCFQTTYLNESYAEYFDPRHDYRLLWVVRNPFSVVYSMQYNWERFAFDELFDACGRPLLGDEERSTHRIWGRFSISRSRRACLSYVGKQLQVLELEARLGEKRLLVVDYDEMVRNRRSVVPRIYDFVGLQYADRYSGAIHDRSLRKADLLTVAERRTIDEICMPVYERVRRLAVVP